MRRISLNEKWSGKGIDPLTNETITFEQTSVPGCALRDIIDALKGGDIFYRDHLEKYQKYENFQYVYTKKFDVEKTDETIILVFERLDTYCDIYLNGKLLSYCDNGHISYRFDVTNQIREEDNEIKICFYSPMAKTEGKPVLGGAFTTERMYTRRVQCTYGWDWVGRFATCGITGDVFIEMYPKNEPMIEEIYVYTKSIDAFGAYMGVKIDFGDNFSDKIYDFEIYDDEGVLVKKHSKYCAYHEYNYNVSIENAKLWYPAGYGAQPLYELKVMWDGNCIARTKFGIRTVKIMQPKDAVGSPAYNKCLELKQSSFSKEYDHNTEFSGFILVVNGIRIQARGANWVPCEPYENGKTKEKIRKSLALAKEMGLNMLRVWGGGTFESDVFYDECSRLGIMVTQDFLMACGIYPEKEDWFISHLQKETEYAAKRMRNQACLMWWSGDNENAVRGDDVMEDHPGRSAAMFGIQPVLAKFDPQRDFLPSSPYGGSFYASNTAGTTHNTQYLGNIFEIIDKENLDDYKERYKMLRARFIAEEPTFGGISTYSLKKFLTEEDIFGEDLTMFQYHTKGNPALPKELFTYFVTLTEKILGSFKNGYDRVFKMQYIQYECVRVVLEQLRREMWFESGVVFWMMSDCWPAAAGWAFTDYYLMPKASFYSFKRCAKPQICSIDYNHGMYQVVVSNNDVFAVGGEISVFAIDTDTNTKTDIWKGDFSVQSQSAEEVYSFEDIKNGIIVAEIKCGATLDRAFYKSGNLHIKESHVTYEIQDDKIILKADRYIQAVGIDGNVILGDNWFSMLPGEEKEVSFQLTEGKLSDITIAAYGLA